MTNPEKNQAANSYHKDLEKHILKFAAILDEFTHSYGEEKARHKSTMESHLELIQAAASEIKINEIHKYSVKLAKDFHLYVSSHSSENYAALEQDLQTLRECNQIK